MLSIVIPTYNCPCVALVEELVRQIDAANIEAEIIVIDDASTDQSALAANEVLSTTKHCRYKKLLQHLTISQIRNLLFDEAKFALVMCLDADVFPVHDDFVLKYVEASKTADIVCGGLCFRNDKSITISPLRYCYGTRYEALTAAERAKHPYARFISLSFIINRTTTSNIRFDEAIDQYGFEDVLFGKTLAAAGATIRHIDNPVYHDNFDTSAQFVAKTRLAIENIVYHADVIGEYSRLLNFYRKVERWHLTWLPRLIFKYLHSPIERQLCSNNPSMLLFTLYKLSYLAYFAAQQQK